MLTNSVLLICLLLVPLVSAVSVIGTLGISVPLSANTATEINFITGEQLSITVGQESDITVTLITALSTSFPTGYVGLSTGLSYEVRFSNSPTIIAATFTSSAISATILSSAGASIPGVLQYSSSQHFYAEVPSTYNAQRVSFNLPSAGIFAIVGLNVNVPTAVIYGMATTVANDNADHRYQFPNGLVLGIRSSGSGNAQLTVTTNSSTAVSTAPAGYLSTGFYVSISFTGATTYNATIEYAYTASTIATSGINASTLKFFKNVAGTWTAVTGSSVNTETRVVSQTTTSFSEWGLYGQASGSASLSTTLGLAVSLTANTAYVITYTTGESLSITVSQDTELLMTTYARVTSMRLPSGYVELSGALGYSLSATGGAVIISASLTTPSILTNVLGTIGMEYPGVLMVDTTQNAFLWIPSTYTSGKLSFNLPQFSSYVLVGVQSTAVVPVLYTRPQSVPNDNAQRSYSFPDGFLLRLQARGDGYSSLNVIRVTTEPHSSPANWTALGMWYNVTLTGASSLDATLEQTYTDAQLAAANVAASSLRFAVYANGQWTFPSTGRSVDTSANVVTQTTTSFSEWGVYGSSARAIVPAVLWLVITVLSILLTL